MESLYLASSRGSKAPDEDPRFYEELREIIDGSVATSSSLDDPAIPALTSSSSNRVSTLKRSNMCLDFIDEDECQTDRPSKRVENFLPINVKIGSRCHIFQ